MFQRATFFSPKAFIAKGRFMPVMTSNLLGDLRNVDKELERLHVRSKGRENIFVDRVMDLGIHWKDQGHNNRSGYFAKIDGRELPLTDGAIKTACRMVKTEPKYFSQFKDKSEFPRALIKGIDDGKRRDKGVLIRHNGLQVTAVLPQDYKVHDSAHLMEDFLEPLKENLGDIKGIQSLEQGDGDICSYRIVMGTNIMPSLDDMHGQFMAFFVTTSENGIVPTICTLGLYRAVCTNTALREQTITRWDHRKVGFSAFYEKVAGVIHKTSYFQSQYSAVFEELLKTPLGDMAATDLISAMYGNRLITKQHAETAALYAGNQTEDGRQVSTQWDLFNVLTAAARDLPGVQAREQAESKTLTLFTDPGGLAEQLRRAHESRPRELALA
jgi:hypothetical protein